MIFPYQTCTTWIREKAAGLTTRGLTVEVKENTAPTRSVLLKANSPQIEVELVVWESGATSMIVFDCVKTQYVLDQHDLVLVGNQFEQKLDLFFDLLSKRLVP